MDKNLSTAELFKKLKSNYGYEKRSKDTKRTVPSGIEEHPGCSNKQNANRSSDRLENRSYLIPTKKTSLGHSKQNSVGAESPKDYTWVEKHDDVDYIISKTDSSQILSKKVPEFDSFGAKPQKKTVESVADKLETIQDQQRRKNEGQTRKRFDSSGQLASEQNKSYLFPPKKSLLHLTKSSVDEESSKEQTLVKKPNKVDEVTLRTDSSPQFLTNEVREFNGAKYFQKKADETLKTNYENKGLIRKQIDSSGHNLSNIKHSLERNIALKKSLPEHSSAESPVQEISKDQTWVKKADHADFKITSQTESLLQVLPNKVQGLDFIGPKYSQPSKTTEIINEPDLDESDVEEESSDKDVVPHLEFVDRVQILCDRTESDNPFRVIYGNISIQTSIDDSKLNGVINKIKLLRNLPELSLTQMWAMVKVFEGENVIFVETPSLNSSSTYFVPMIAKTVKNEKLYGPSNIILAANVQMVAKIERVLKHLSEEKLRFLSYYGDDVDINLEEKFALCDFVISTPKNFSNLLVTIKPTKLGKLNCVAFDSIHRMNDFSHEEIVQLIRALEKLTQMSKKGLHFVMTTEFWTQQSENITQATLKNPILFLACPLQAAICSNIRLSLKVLENNTEKLKKCTAILKKINFSKRIILCSNIKEMAAIESYLKTCSVNYVVNAEENSERSVICENPEKDTVTILCSEAMLSGLEIDDADCLIIFSLFPSLKASFSVFQSHLTKESSQKCAGYIFIDEKSDFKLTDMISNLNVEKPTTLKQILKNAKEAYETSKLDVPFCEKLMQFGKCSAELLCPKRHILDAYRDSDKTKLSKKRVILDIVNVYDATHYYGKVSCQLNGDRLTESDVNIFRDYRENFRSLSHVLSKLQGRPKIGDQVIVPSDVTDVMERGEIVNILRRDKNLVPIAVSVFIESGLIVHRNVDEVYELPQKLKNLPVESVNIILGGIVPSDSSGIWSPNVTAIARNSLMNENPDRKTLFTGNIQMVIGNTIVLDDIICYEIRNDLEFAQKFSMSQQLLTSKYAEQDKTVIENLIDSCIKAGLKIGLDSSPIVPSSKEDEIEKYPIKENLKDSPSKTDAMSSSNLENEETKNGLAQSEASNLLNEETENVEAATDSSNFQNEETENPQDSEKEDSTPSETPSEDISSDFNFGKCEEDDNKNMNFESLFMKMFSETLNEFKENDEWDQIPMKADVSSNENMSDDDSDLKNKSEVSPREKLNDSSTGETVQTQREQNYIDDLMAEKYEIREESKIQLNKTVDDQVEATKNNENKTESQIEVSQTCQNEKTLKTDIDESKVYFEESQDTESEFNPTEEPTRKNESSKSEIEDKAKSLEAMPDKERTEKSQNDGNNEVQRPNLNVDCKALTADQVEANEREKSNESNIVADECEDKESTDEPSVSYFSPKVYWRQKDDLIWARIMILDVKDYKFKYAKNFFTFRADVDEKVYFLTILTFAPIIPESFTCNVTGQYVEVRFEAAFKGFDWPRLTYLDKGSSRIKRDPDFFDEDIQCLPICDEIFLLGEQRRKLKEEFGTIKKPDEFGYDAEARGAPPDCDLDSESNDSDSNFIDPKIDSLNLVDYF